MHLNLRILNELMIDEDEKIFFKQFLLGKGFSFNVHNNIKNHDGKNHYAIYQYVIITLTNEQIKIICKSTLFDSILITSSFDDKDNLFISLNVSKCILLIISSSEVLLTK